MKYLSLQSYNFLLLNLFLLLQLTGISQTIEQMPPEANSKLKEFTEIAETALNQGNLNIAASNYNKIAFIYWKNARYREAIEIFQKSTVIYQKTEDLTNLRSVYTNIGVLYTDLQEIEMSEPYFKKSIEIARIIGKKEEITSSLIDLAYILSALKRFDESNQNLDEAYKLAKKIDNTQLTISCLGLYAENYRNLNQPSKAGEYMKKYDRIQQFAQTETMREEFDEEKVKKMAETQREKLAKEAKEYELEVKQLLLKSTQDSLSYAEQMNRIRRKEIDLLKKDSAIRSLEIKEQKARENETKALIKQKEATAKNQKIIIYSAGVIILLILIASLSLKKRVKEKKRANKILEEQNVKIAEKGEELSIALTKIQKQNKQITQSINYAQSIQKAMLPNSLDLNKYIPESFIFFQPRDIVSGDFYWFRKAQKDSNTKNTLDINKKKDFSPLEKNDCFLISAVDCTGHGVPGAFMSMIGYNLLDDITDKGICRPDLVLQQLNAKIQIALNQHVTKNKDGMDMAFCQIDIVEKKLFYAGAKNPLVYVQNNEVFQLTADHIPIGGTFIKEPEFTLKEINIDKPTYCYIFSDGFVDQFGGDKGRKFMIKKFRQLLLEIHKMPMEEQHKILSLTIEAWMGEEYSQIDDILIIGFLLTPERFNQT